MSRTRWWVALMLAAAIVSLPAPAFAATAGPLCAQAADLIREADPGAALALIDERQQELDALAGEATDAICATESEAARANQSAADALVERAKEADPEAKAILLAEAEELDAKDAELVKLTAEQTPAQSAEKRWTTFLTDRLQPWGAPLAVALAVALGWLVLGRLLIQAYPARWKLPAGSGAGRLIWLGAVLAALSGLVFTLLVPASRGFWLFASIVLALLLGIAGAGLLSGGLASRLRITIEATPSADTKDTPSPARIVAILRKLGADAPRGIEVPIGTDVGVLADAVTKTSTPGWVSSIVSALGAVLGFTPWKVVLHRTAEGTAVVITRNGRTMDSTNISAGLLGTGMPTATPDVLIASFILMTVANGYGKRAGFEGLLGSRSWKSIGLIASTQKEIAPPASTTRSEEGRLLFAAALQEDNVLARVALHEHLYRDQEDPAVSEGYARWLLSESAKPLPAEDTDDGAGTSEFARAVLQAFTAVATASERPTASRQASPDDVMKARLLYASIVVTLNVLESKPGLADAKARLHTAFDRLVALLKRIDPLEGALKEIRAQVDVLADAVATALTRAVPPPVAGQEPWDADERQKIDAVALNALGPGAYNAMCTLAAADADLPKAIALYRVVSVDPALRAWSLEDPALGRLRQDAQMWDIVAKSNDLLEVSPFAAHAKGLRTAGLTSTRAIAETQPQTLAQLLGIRAAKAVRLVQLAQVLDTLPEGLKNRSAELAAILVETAATDLVSLGGKIEDVAAEVRKVPGQREGEPLHEEAEEWLVAAGASPPQDEPAG